MNLLSKIMLRVLTVEKCKMYMVMSMTERVVSERERGMDVIT